MVFRGCSKSVVPLAAGKVGGSVGVEEIAVTLMGESVSQYLETLQW